MMHKPEKAILKNEISHTHTHQSIREEKNPYAGPPFTYLWRDRKKISQESQFFQLVYRFWSVKLDVYLGTPLISKISTSVALTSFGVSLFMGSVTFYFSDFKNKPEQA
jgi:hypothetical protein